MRTRERSDHDRGARGETQHAGVEHAGGRCARDRGAEDRGAEHGWITDGVEVRHTATRRGRADHPAVASEMACEPVLPCQSGWHTRLRGGVGVGVALRQAAARPRIAGLPDPTHRTGDRGGSGGTAGASRGRRTPAGRQRPDRVRTEECARGRCGGCTAGARSLCHRLAQPTRAFVRPHRAGEPRSRLATPIPVLWRGRQSVAEILQAGRGHRDRARQIAERACIRRGAGGGNRRGWRR